MILNRLAFLAWASPAFSLVSRESPPLAPEQAYDPNRAPSEESLREFSGDWLFHVRTTSCHGDAFDNGTYTSVSRTFLPMLCLGSVGLILCTGGASKRVDPPPDAENASANDSPQSSPQSPPASGRLWHVDFARICAVMCVIFEHCGGMSYTHRNVGFGLWWALPYLYLTSGMSSMISKSSMWGYIFRLLLVFAVGVLANLFADVVTRRDWRHDFGNTIFQMFFVVMLLIMAPLAEPLRLALRDRAAGQSVGVSTQLMAGWWGLLAAAALAAFVRGYTGDSPDIVTQTFQDEKVSHWIQFYAPVLRHTPIILVHVGGTLFLSLLATIICSDHLSGVVGWVLLAFTYLQMIVIPWDQDSFAHLVTLNILGMVTYQWPPGDRHVTACRGMAYHAWHGKLP
ncbi:unnamed protein product [Effrenium voratum]|nr:unnamed protein product [Effrenium voratum]